MSNSGGLETIRELEERARTGVVEMSESVCLNMSHFKAALRELRSVDDNIILRLNSTNTAAESECLALFKVLQTAYNRRSHDISYCLGVLDKRIAERKHQEVPTFSLEAQRKWAGNEEGVEGIVRRRTLTAFRSRCPLFELPREYVDILEQRPMGVGKK
ncbi:hypothetical protein GGF46_004148 [Coemansia sp. RSA 552]|nr:hypothetical protein GGF46_004148 [Coemansia sp. RSA 552]